jgi:hypothetical protein
MLNQPNEENDYQYNIAVQWRSSRELARHKAGSVHRKEKGQ